MTSETGNTVIHRKARGARDDYNARAMSPAKALRLALAKAADAQFDLAVHVTTVEQTLCRQDSIAEALDDGGLLLLLEGPGGRRGVINIERQMLTAIIEVQTTGKVTDRAIDARPVTRTDAAIVAPLIDAMLVTFENGLSGEDDPQWRGYRFGAMMEDTRGVSLVLESGEFHHFKIVSDLGGGMRSGGFSLLMPFIPPVARSGADPGNLESLQKQLEENALEAPVAIEGILARVTLPLDKICRLKAGDMLDLTKEQPLSIRLETTQRHLVAEARLGQMNGLRAVRLAQGRLQDLPVMPRDAIEAEVEILSPAQRSRDTEPRIRDEAPAPADTPVTPVEIPADGVGAMPPEARSGEVRDIEVEPIL